MSRIGNKPVEIPAGVTVDVAPGRVTVNGPKGELTQTPNIAMDVKRNMTMNGNRPHIGAPID